MRWRWERRGGSAWSRESRCRPGPRGAGHNSRVRSDQALVKRKPALNDRREVGAGHALEVDVGSAPRQPARRPRSPPSPASPSARSGRCGSPATASCVAGASTPITSTRDRSPHVRFDRVQRRRARGVARDHESFAPAASRCSAISIENASSSPGCGRRTGTARRRPGTGSPRRAATRAAHAGRSTRRRRSRTRRSADAGVGTAGGMVPEAGRYARPPTMRALSSQHVPDSGPAGARELRSRPGRGAAPDRGIDLEVFAFAPGGGTRTRGRRPT